ncbi:MAG: hypothetical protein IPJ16_17655 [Bacteroidales bacterium]|nr:hypothetical protein [Bacteroidales bacterium]
MKREKFKLIIMILLMFVVSCDEPETIVTNIVHADGTITRMIEMRSPNNNSADRFKQSDLQVPFDDSWTIKDSLEVSPKGDTVWVKRAEKLFLSADEINMTYRKDSGANKNISRNSVFEKRFRWFNTVYRFAEKIDKKMEFGYPISDFLNKEELIFFYSPESIKEVYQNGPDSTKFRSFGDVQDSVTDKWLTKSLVSEWIGKFSNLTKTEASEDLSFQSLKAREDDFVNTLTRNEKNFDSLWTNGIILREMIGEQHALKFKTEADSAINMVTNNLLLDFKEYSVRIVMPGKLISTNGYKDSSSILLWPVKSDYFLTEPYEMWAESKVTNIWAWIISGLFVLFVFTGLVFRIKKKG